MQSLHFSIRCEHRPELVENFTHGMLHGGVSAAVIAVGTGAYIIG